MITSNVAAQRSYAACGFAVTRQLLGYEQAQLAAAAFDPARYELCGAEHSMALLSAALPSDLPWQLAPQSLAGLVAPVRALRRRDGRAAALFDPSGATPRLLGLGVLPGAQGQGLGTHLLASLLQAFPGHWRISAMVPDTLIDGFLLARGWQRSPLAQYEMLWRA